MFLALLVVCYVLLVADPRTSTRAIRRAANTLSPLAHTLVDALDSIGATLQALVEEGQIDDKPNELQLFWAQIDAAARVRMLPLPPWLSAVLELLNWHKSRRPLELPAPSAH
eukprot:GABV01014500.1.p3 GENE.GABV01014500.1~~GABV01014500.1.p3  ORF type:complete len:112 (-),score=37.98 GABV01014500.1:11-346(-)